MEIFQKFGNMKFAYRNREFWCKGYYVDTVGKNTAAIKKYIADQLKADKESDQLSLFDRVTRLRVANNNTLAARLPVRTCAPLVLLGLRPKMKYHALCAWIFIIVLYCAVECAV